MRTHLFDPLGMGKSFNDEDLGFGANLTAEGLAKIGQMMLNRGAYGDKRFFSEQTFARLLPRSLTEFYPALSVEWGIGITWMRQAHPQAGQGDVPAGTKILGDNIIGHGAATAAILRVDLDHDLVIAQARRAGGKRYNEFLNKLLLVLAENLRD